MFYYIKPGKWFGFNYHNECQDNFIEVNIGELFNFKDCIPRLIKTGEYNENIKKLNSENLLNSKILLLEQANKNIKKTVEIIKNTFDIVIKNIDLEVEDKRKEKLKTHLIKSIKTFDDLKQIDLKAKII